MSTYCRITGNSRGLPKPHYFPLLPPISPADAKRLCRITGKSYGLPTHHYIPVVTTLFRKRKIRCRVTAKSDGQQGHHFVPTTSDAVKHSPLKSFRYVAPVLDANAELLELLGAKVEAAGGDHDAKFVYTVHERQYGLILPAQLEAAVRAGDVRDMMLAKDADKLVLKLRKGASIEVDIRDATLGQWELFEGEGPNQDIVVRRKKQRRAADANDWRRKIFEDKEKEADSEEERISRIRSKRLTKSNRSVSKANPILCSWKNVIGDGVPVRSDVTLDQKVRKSILNVLGKRNLAELVGTNESGAKPIVSSLPSPLKVDAESVDLCHSLPGLIQQPALFTDGIIGFRVANVITPFQPNLAQVDVAIADAISRLNEDKVPLEKVLAKHNISLKKRASMLVHLDDIPVTVAEIAKIMECRSEVAKHKFEQGIKLTLKNSEKYIPGQFIADSSGEIFIPGNVVETAIGPQFVPGFAVLNDDSDTKFLPGYIVKEQQNEPIGTFVAGQFVLTRDGEKFVQGQVVTAKDSTRFMAGQTIFTEDGVKFIPGQIVEDLKTNCGYRFVPGQTTMTSDGAQFVPGQFVETPSGLLVFRPGQSVLNENSNWEFVQGQIFKTDDSDLVYVPGKEIIDEDGHHQFVPGRTLINDSLPEIFVPGVTMTEKSGKLKFISGLELETESGAVFVEGMFAKLDNDDHLFLVGKVSSLNETDDIQFEQALSPKEVILHDIVPHLGFSLNLTSKSDNDDTVVFGHMVQSSQGIEFFPGEAVGLPAGKIIPGRLVKEDETQFIPGTMIDGKFTPGQFVTTDTEKKFIPGQVIETNAGPKFVPGQVLNTSSGPKFVPGQTMDTENGPKFIPGQIIETKSGPTFIPGQVISTDEEGSRFVPGQVVDTVEGPRFVPGRVVETGDGVAFIPGQIVETEDGLRFVAPDLEDDPEGGYQFTLQGFEVAQEELKMIQRNPVPSACIAGQLAIDWKMLQQLSDAGMAVGRQIPVDIPDVDIKSSHIVEVACNIINNLNMDPSYSIQINHILSNVMQIVQSNGSLHEEEVVKDENLQKLIDLTEQFKYSLDSPEFLSTLGNEVENIIKTDFQRKQQNINTLHAATVDLAAKMREKQMGKVLPSPAVQIARKMANKMNLDGSSSIKMSHILSNILQLKELEVAVIDEEISDDNLKTFINVASKSGDIVDDEEYIQVLGKALENAIKVDIENQFQNMQVLETITSNLAAKIRAKKSNNVLPVLIVEKACQVADKLGLDPKFSTKIGYILLNMQQAKLSGVSITSDNVKNEDNIELLNAAIGCGNNEELLQSVGNALENIIGQSSQDVSQKIDSLYTFSTNLAQSVKNNELKEVFPLSAVAESACKVAAKLGLGGLELIKINDILLNLQEIQQCDMPTAIQKTTDKNLKIILTLVSERKFDPNSIESLQTFVTALEETLKADPKQQLNTISTLHNITANIADEINQQKVNESLPLSIIEFIYKVVEELDIDPSYSKKIGKILNNLLQMKEAKIPSPNGKIKDKNLKNLVHFICNLDAKKSNTEIYKDLGEALMNIIKAEVNKERTINTLLALSDDLVLKVRAQKICVEPTAVAEVAHLVAKKLNIDNLGSIKIKNILSSLKQMQALNISEEEIKNENLKSLFKNTTGQENCQSNTEYFKKLGSTLEDIALNSESIIETIDTLHNLTEKFQIDMKRKEHEPTLSLNVIENACQLAENLNLTPAQSIKMGQILSNLLQMDVSKLQKTSTTEIKNENLKTLLNLVDISETEGCDVLQSLGKALEKTIKIDPDRKLNIINSLHNATIKLVSSAHKKPKNKHIAEMVCQITQKFKVDELTAKKISKILENMQQIKQSNVTILQDIEDKNLKKLLNRALEFEEGKGDLEILQSLGNALETTIKTDIAHKLKPIDGLHSLTSKFMDETYPEQAAPALSTILPQAASAVAEELNVDYLHSIKIGKILENLHQIQASGLTIPIDEIKDENLRSLMHIPTCGLYESEVWLQNVSDKLKDIVKQDLVHKFETIHSLDISTKDLASEVQGRVQCKALSVPVLEKACEMARKLQLNAPNSLKVGEIMHNLQQIKTTKITFDNSNVKDKNLKTLLKIAKEMKDETNPKFTAIISTTIEKMISQNLNHKQQIINTLHSLTKESVSFIQKQQLHTVASLPITEMASQLADNVNANLESSIKIDSILSNIQQIKLLYSNISPDIITDENLRILLSTGVENGENFENVEYIQVICDTLENIIKVDLDHKEQNIDALHLSVINLATKLQAKKFSATISMPVLEIACNVAEKLNIDPSYSIKLSNILLKVEKMGKLDIANMKEETDDETIRSLFHVALECVHGADSNYLIESLEHNLENIIQSTLNNNQQSINALHTMTVELTSKVRDRQTNKILSASLFEKATKVASNLDISPTYVIKISNILANLQQIKQSNVAVFNDEIVDENLRKLLNVVSSCENNKSEEQLAQILGDTLESIIKEDLSHKLQHIDILQALTAELASNIAEKQECQSKYSPSIEVASKVANKLNIGPSHSIKMGNIISNLKQIKESHVAILDEIIDPKLKKLVDITMEVTDDRSIDKLFQVLGNALEDVICTDLDNKLQTIDNLHSMTANLASNISKKQSSKTLPLPVIEIACSVASKLNIDPSYSVKMGHILSNLQQIKQSNVPVLTAEISDDNLKTLLNIAMECDDNNNGAHFLQIIGDALQNRIVHDAENKLQSIDTLYLLSTELTSKIHNAEVGKIWSLPIIETACNVASDLNIDPMHTIQLSQILSNLKQMIDLKGQIVHETIQNETLKKILATVNECENCDEIQILQKLGNAVKLTIKADLKNKLQIIDTLHGVSDNVIVKFQQHRFKSLPSPTVINSACEVVKNLKLETSTSVPVSFTIWNLQHLNSDNLKEILKNNEDENLKCLIKTALKFGDKRDTSFVKAICDVLQKVVKGNSDKKFQTIKTLCSSTTNFASKVSQKNIDNINSSPESKISEVIVRKFKLGASSAVLIENILGNLQKIKNSTIPHIFKYGVKDESLQKVLEIVSICRENSDKPETLESLSEALQQVLTENIENKEIMVSMLHATSANLVTNIPKCLSNILPPVFVAQQSESLVKKLNVEPTYSVLIGHILKNAQQIEKSDLGKILCNGIKDENVSTVLKTVLECKVKGMEAVQLLSDVICKSIKGTKEQKEKKLNFLYTTINNLIEKFDRKDDISANVAEAIAPLIVELDLNPSNSVQIIQIMNNLQIIKNSNLPIILEKGALDDNVQMVFDLIGECSDENDEVQQMKEVSCAIKNMLDKDPKNISHKISILHAISNDVVSSARVQDKSLMAPVVLKISEKLVQIMKMDSSVMPMVEYILNSLWKINKDNINNILNNGIRDENLTEILKEVLNCKFEGIDLIQELGNILFKSIEGTNVEKKEKLAALYSSIDNMQTTLNLWTSKEKDVSLSSIAAVVEVSASLSDNLGLDSLRSAQVVEILHNLQKIKMSNLPDLLQKGLVDENIQTVLSLASSGSEFQIERLQLQSIGDLLESFIVRSPKEKSQIISILHATVSDVASIIPDEFNQSSFLVAKLSKNLIGKLAINPNYAVLIKHVIQDIQQIKKSNIPQILSNGLKNKHLRHILEVVREYEADDSETARILCDVLYETITGTSEQKENLINLLYSSTVNLKDQPPPMPVIIDIAAPLITKFDLNPSSTQLIINTLSNLQKLTKSDLPKLLKHGTLDENIQVVLETLLTADGKQSEFEQLKVMASFLENIVNQNPKCKLQFLNLLHATTTDLVINGPVHSKNISSIPVAKLSETVAEQMKVDPTCAILIEHIIQNIQNIPKTVEQLVLDQKDVDDNLKEILNVVLTSDSSSQSLMQQLGEIILHTVKGTPEEKVWRLNSLYIKTCEIDLNSSSSNSSVKVAMVATPLVAKLDLNLIDSTLLIQTLGNLQKIQNSNLGTLLHKGKIDKNVQMVMKLISRNVNQMNGDNPSQTIENLLEYMINENPENKSSKIAALHATTTKLASSIPENFKNATSLAIVNLSEEIAKKIELNPSSIVLIERMLQNLHQAEKSDLVNILNKGISNQNLEELLKAVIQCNLNDDNAISIITKPFEKFSKCTIGDKENLISELYASVCDIVSVINIQNSDNIPLIIEVATPVIAKLNLNPSISMPVIKIFTNLQKIKQSNVIHQLQKGSIDKNIQSLLDLTCALDENKNRAEQVQGACDILENIMGKNPENQSIIINNLHAISEDLASNLSSGILNLGIDEAVVSMTKDMNLNPSMSILIGQILENVQKLENSDLQSIFNGTANETLQDLMKTTLNCNADESTEKITKKLVMVLQNSIKGTAGQKEEKINHLYTQSINAISNLNENYENKSMDLYTSALKLTKRLHLPTSSAATVGYLISNLQQIKKSDIQNILQCDKENVNFLMIADLISLNDDATNCTKLQRLIENSLEEIIKGTPREKLRTVNVLHAITVDIVSNKLHHNVNDLPPLSVTKIAIDFTKKMKLNRTNAQLIGSILWNLQKLNKIDIENLLNKGIDNIDLLDLLKAALTTDDGIEVTHAMSEVLQTILKSYPNQEEENINLLYSSVVNLLTEPASESAGHIPTEVIEMAANLSKKFSLNPSCVALVASIFCNIQKIKELPLSFLIQEGDLDKSTKIVLNLVLECGECANEDGVLKTFQNIIENAINNGNPMQKLMTLNLLHSTSTDIVANLLQEQNDNMPTELIFQIASAVTKKMNVDASNIPIIENLLWKLQQICKNNANIVFDCGPINANLQVVLEHALKDSAMASDQIIHILAESLPEIITGNPIDKEEKLYSLYSSVFNLSRNIQKRHLNALCSPKKTKIVCSLVTTFEMAPETSELIEQVLNNLQKIIELNSADELEYMKLDDCIKEIIDTVLKYHLVEAEVLPEILGKVLKDAISGSSEEKLNKLTILHTYTTNAISLVGIRHSIINPPPRVTRVAEEVIKNSNIDLSNSRLVEQVIWNLEHLTPSNIKTILKKGVPTENLRALVKVLAEQNEDSDDITITLGLAMQKLMKGSLEQKEQKIQELYSSTFLILSEIDQRYFDKIPDISTEIVIPLTKRLQLDLPSSNLVEDALINLRKIKKSILPKILQKGVVDENMQVVLNLLIACNDDDEELTQFKSMSDALETLIQSQSKQKLSLISKLHATTLDLLPSIKNLEYTIKKPHASMTSISKSVVKKLNIEESKTILIEKLLTNFEDIRKSASNIHMEDIIANENFKYLLQIILDVPNKVSPENAVQVLGDALQTAIIGTKDQKNDEVNTLYAKSINLLTSLPKKCSSYSTQTNVTDVVNSNVESLKLGSIDRTLLTEIMNNVQIIKKSHLLNALMKGVLDERLQIAVNLILKSEENIDKMDELQSIGTALQCIISESPGNPQQILNFIHMATIDLVSLLQKDCSQNPIKCPTVIVKIGQETAKKMKLDASQSALISQILWNLQQVKKVNLNNISSDVIMDDASKKFIRAVFEDCEFKTDSEIAQTLADVFEQAIEGSEIEKIEKINYLYPISVNLVSNAKAEIIDNFFPQTVSKITDCLIKELKFDPWHTNVISHLLCNLKKIKQSNMYIPIETGVKYDCVKYIKDLLAFCDKSQTEIEMLQSFSSGLQKIIQGNEKQKIKILNKLHAVSERLICNIPHQKINAVPAIVAKNAANVAKKLELDPSTAKLVQHIMWNIQQPNETDECFSNQQGLAIDSLKAIIDVMEVDEGKNMVKIANKIGRKLLAVIKGTLDEKKQKIHELYSASVGVSIPMPNEPSLNTLPEATMQIADKVVQKLKLDLCHTKLIGHILCNLRYIQQKLVSPGSEEGTLDENLQVILDLALEFKDCSKEQAILPAFGAALEKVIRGDADWKLQSLNQLHAATVAELSKSYRRQVLNHPPPLVAETSSYVAKKLHLVRSSSLLLGHLLWNLQQIKKADLQRVIQKSAADDNLQTLLTKVLENCGKESGELTQALGDSVYKLLKNNANQKDEKIDTLYSLTINLLTNLNNGNLGETSAIFEATEKIADKLNIDESYSEKVGHILSNLQQIKRANVALFSEKDSDKSLKTLLNFTLECSNDNDGRPFLEQMRNALESSILVDLEQKLQIINTLHSKTANLASKVKDKQLRKFIPRTAIETACKVASKLNIDPSYSVKISGILSNLQEIRQSNAPFIYQKITDESLRKLLDLSLDCDSQKEGVELLQSLGDALEKTIKANMAHKCETIDSLHTLTLDLTSKVREEQSKKILPVSVIERACQVASKLQINPALSIKMSNILANLLRVKQSFVLLREDDISDTNLKLLWKVASTCDDGPEGINFFHTVGDLLEDIIRTDLAHKDEIISSVHALTGDLFSKIRYRKPNKALLLKNLIRNNIIIRDDVVEKLSSILTEDDLGVRSAFQHMSEENPEFIDKVLQNAASMLRYIPADERKTAHTLHRAIIKAVAETSERKVQKMLQKVESEDFHSLVADAIGLAKALGLGEVVLMLSDILKDSRSIPILAQDPIVMEVLKRLTIMRQLAEKRPNFGYALHELKLDPYAARNDPRLRQLVRESAVLMVIPEESYVLRSSEDIPCSLFFGDNCLAVEDFVVRSRQSGSTFLILKRGVQMVVPREAARDVLTGKVPYTLLDENGIQYFKPLHVFNALNLPKVATNRFSNYGYSPKMTKPVRSASSARVPDDATKNLIHGSCSSQEAIVNRNVNQMKHRLHGENSYNC